MDEKILESENVQNYLKSLFPKPKELLNIEKILKIDINDFAFEDSKIECVTIENVEISNEKMDEAIKYLIYLKRLFIYNCKIESTYFIDNLPNLEELTINNSRLTILNINKPSKILKLLDLSENKISDISFISKFENLKNLSLSRNNIRDISILKNYTTLETLNLDNNKIEDIEALNLLEVNELFIGQNKIIDLTPLYKSLKNDNIKFINAFENPLVYPPEEIVSRGQDSIIRWFEMIFDNIKICKQKIKKAKINDDEIIDLGMMGLTDLNLIPELFELEKLQELILSNHYAEYNESGTNWDEKHSINSFYSNNLTHIPIEIKKLKNLKKLFIGGDWKDGDAWNRWRIKDISHLFSLKNLEFLNVSNNIIEKISVTNRQKLPSLKIIHLNNNRLKTFNTLTKFPNLEELYLSNNKLNAVNNLKSILSLKTVDLHSNNIKTIEPLLPLLTTTKIQITDSKWKKGTINIRENPLKEPNYETINTGKEAVIRYFKSEWNTIVNKELKLVLVGNSEVGKTTLVKYLDGEKDLDKSHDATHWMIEKDISSKEIIKKIGEKCNIRVFDFGGQDYYHDTHQIFFTKNTIYFLLWDEKTNNLNIRPLNQKVNGKEKSIQTQDYPVEYWLESIKHFVKEKSNIVKDKTIKYEYDSSVLLIQNKVSVAKEIIPLNNLALKNDKKYPFIYDFININILKEKRNLNHFDFLLSEIISEMKTIGSDILEYQHLIRNKLNEYNEKQILNLNEFMNYCNNNLPMPISKEEAKDLCSYLKQLGLIFYLSDFSKIYLNKRWVFESIYKILDGLFELNGEFDKEYISQRIEIKIDDEKIDGLLLLMEEFKIIFHDPKFPNEKYIAPLYLPKEPLEGVSLFLLENKIPYRRFEYNGFIHKTFILDFFNKYGQKTLSDGKKFYYWKDGLIIKDDSTEQILHIKFKNGKNNEDDKSNACVDIYKLNEGDKENVFVSEVINYIKKINNNFFKLDDNDIKDEKIATEDYYEEMVTLDNIDFVSLKLLNENSEKKKFIFNERKIERENIEQEKFKTNINLSDYKQFIKNTNFMKKIFISYSKDDLKLVNQFQDHLSSLKRDGIVTSWFCTELLAGGEWDKDIQKHFDESDIICIMISPNLMRTDYIHKYEIAKAFDKQKLIKDFKIVPIILDYCRWSTKDNNLSQFTALPYIAKPVNDFSDKNMAWYIIVESLRIMIETNIQPEGEGWYKNPNLPKDIRNIYQRIVAGLVDNNSVIK